MKKFEKYIDEIAEVLDMAIHSGGYYLERNSCPFKKICDSSRKLCEYDLDEIKEVLLEEV